MTNSPARSGKPGNSGRVSNQTGLSSQTGQLSGRVLIVEDERPLARMISLYLSKAGFDTTEIHDGAAAPDKVAQLRPDVVILDLGLPGLDGLEVCSRIRAFSDCYILMLTARGAERDRITGLQIGADDYITKPFNIRELVIRIQSVMRRPRKLDEVLQAGTSLKYGGIILDTLAHEVSVHGTTVTLTRTEFELVQSLMLKPDEAVSRRDLVHQVWNTTWEGDERIVDVHIGNLRRKLESSASGSRFIDTVRGVGYRMAPQ